MNNGQKVDGRTVGAKLRTHTDPAKTILMTDDSSIYDQVGKSFKEHHVVNHSAEEYVRHEPDGHLATTNTAEGYFANLKRQINGRTTTPARSTFRSTSKSTTTSTTRGCWHPLSKRFFGHSLRRLLDGNALSAS